MSHGTALSPIMPSRESPAPQTFCPAHADLRPGCPGRGSATVQVGKEETMDQSRPAQSPVVELTVHKGLPAGIDAYARQKVSAVIRQAPEPVLSMRIRLTRHSNPAVA